MPTFFLGFSAEDTCTPLWCIWIFKVSVQSTWTHLWCVSTSNNSAGNILRQKTLHHLDPSLVRVQFQKLSWLSKLQMLLSLDPSLVGLHFKKISCEGYYSLPSTWSHFLHFHLCMVCVLFKNSLLNAQWWHLHHQQATCLALDQFLVQLIFFAFISKTTAQVLMSALGIRGGKPMPKKPFIPVLPKLTSWG